MTPDMNLNECSVLAVDDTPANIDLLVGLLGEDYHLSVALSGKDALNQINENLPDLILLDIMMPKMNGLEVLQRLKQKECTSEIPVLMLTAISDRDQKSLCFAKGAVDYILKPFNPDELLARVKTHLTLAVTRRELKLQNENLEARVQHQTQEIRDTQQATIESMAALAEYRDPETGMHINRVKEYVKELATALAERPEYAARLTPDEIKRYKRSAPLHDIGKVGVPDNILLKPGRLTDEEFEVMKEHSAYGAQAISSVQKRVGPLSFLNVAREMAWAHHEKWNGKGYPRGLKGEEIPLCARIMALADVYDALISRRVYKPPFTHSTAVKIINEESGVSFDPDLVVTFNEITEKFRDIGLEHCESEEQREALLN